MERQVGGEGEHRSLPPGSSVPLEHVCERHGNTEQNGEHCEEGVAEERDKGCLSALLVPFRGLMSPSRPRRVRWWFRFLYAAVVLVLGAALAGAMGYVVQRGSEVQRDRYIAWMIGGLCSLAAVTISLYGIILHLDNYSKPRLQRWVIRLLWMVPVYSISSFCSLTLYLDVFCRDNPVLNSDDYILFDTIREFYEAFAIFSFLRLCLAWLDEAIPGGDAVFHIAQRNAKPFMPPFRSGEPVGTGFLNFCRTGTMDYVVVQLLSTVVTFISVEAGGGAHGIFGQGELFNMQKMYPYMVIVKSAAQAWAIWCLTLLYRMTKEDLAPLKPLGKFLCIKLIVFFTFWQSVLWALLEEVGLIQVNAPWTDAWTCLKDSNDRVAIYDHLLICFEMLGFSLAHLRIFSWSDFRNDTLAQLRSTGALRSGFRAMFDVSDVNHEMRARLDQYRALGSEALNRMFGFHQRRWPRGSSTDPLLSPDFPADESPA